MQLEHHPIVKEFPEYRDVIHQLKIGDPEFRERFDEYHRLDREVYRIEQDIEPVAEEFWMQLKRRRLYLKDWLWPGLGHLSRLFGQGRPAWFWRVAPFVGAAQQPPTFQTLEAWLGITIER